MENRKYLTEENYQRSNKKVKTIGNILIIIGLVLFILGLIFIVSSFSRFGNQVTNGLEIGKGAVNPGNIFASFGGFALGGFMVVPGLFITIVGLIVRFIIGNRREITAYTAQQIMPVAKEGIDEMAPSIGKVAEEITKGIKDGLEDEKNK